MLISILLISCAWPTTVVAKPTILLTTFEPFQGPTNSSQAVAAELAKLNAPDAPVTYEICGLPTEYDRAYAVAKACFDRADPKPTMVISLGESTNKLKIETRARNRDDDDMADNAGVTRTNAVIDPRGPAEVAMTLPVADMLCASGQFGNYDVANFITPSAAMQNYVCNNLSYRMARYLGPKQVPYGFMHVPDNMKFRYAEGPSQVAERLDRMVRVALVPAASPGPRQSCRRGRLGTATAGTLASVSKACREQVRHRLAELAKAAAGEPSEESY